MTVARNTGRRENPLRGDLARANSCAAVPRGKSLVGPERGPRVPEGREEDEWTG